MNKQRITVGVNVPELMPEANIKLLTEQELKKENISLPKGVLGRASGIFTVADKENGNGRIYSENLWDKALFKSPFYEAMEQRALFGEADHPEGLETSIHRASHIITGVSKAGKVYEGEVDILDTPAGRLVHTILEAGGKIGWSSRGIGDSYYENGKEIVDPESFECSTFDFVIGPSVVESLSMLQESKKKKVLNFLVENKNNNVIRESCNSLLERLQPSKLTEEANKVKRQLETIITEHKNKEKINLKKIESLQTLIDGQKQTMTASLKECKEAKTLNNIYEKAIEQLDTKLTGMKSILQDKSKALYRIQKKNEELEKIQSSLQKRLQEVKTINSGLNQNIKQTMTESQKKTLTVLSELKQTNQRLSLKTESLNLELFKYKAISLNRIIEDKYITEIKKAATKEDVKKVLTSYKESMTLGFNNRTPKEYKNIHEKEVKIVKTHDDQEMINNMRAMYSKI